jgi:HSP20 family molecular chaperone IbpA
MTNLEEENTSMKKNTELAAAQPKSTLPIVHPDVRRRVSPAVDVYETTDGYVLLVDLPGASKEGVGLTMDQGTLTVKAEAAPHHGPDARLLYRELATPLYHRSFTIGDGVDHSNVDARFEDGVLTVKLFKKEERKPREITIQ